MWVTLGHRCDEMKVAVVSATAVSTTQRSTGQSAPSLVDPSCNWMWGKLDRIGAGRIPFVGVAAERTIMSAMRIRGIFAAVWLVAAALALLGVVTDPVVCVAASMARTSFIARRLSASLNPAYKDDIGSLFFLLFRQALDFSSHA